MELACFDQLVIGVAGTLIQVIHADEDEVRLVNVQVSPRSTNLFILQQAFGFTYPMPDSLG